MKIAIASADGATLSPHFGRSTCFIVYETAEGKIIGREVRNNTHTAFAKGECSGEHHADGKEHSHALVVNALSDCQAVLCAGMGWRAAEELKAAGVQALVVDGSATPDETVARYLTGQIKSSGSFCRCQH